MYYHHYTFIVKYAILREGNECTFLTILGCCEGRTLKKFLKKFPFHSIYFLTNKFGVMALINRLKNATISAKLVMSFALIIFLFICEIVVSYIATDEIVNLHRHANYYIQGRSELIIEFHQVFTEMRFFVRDTFMSRSWREETSASDWHQHELMLHGYITGLREKVDRFLYLVDSDSSYPRGADISYIGIMQDVMEEVYATYESLRSEFFIGSQMTFNANEAINNAENIEQMIIEIRSEIVANRDLLFASIERTQRFIAIVSMVSILSACILAMAMAILMVKSFGKRIKSVEELARHVAKGDFDFVSVDESDEISRVFSKIINVFKRLIGEINAVHIESKEGNLGARIRADGFEGKHRDTAAAINNLIDLTQAASQKVAVADSRMRLMYESTPLLIEYWDKDFNLVDCNQYVVKFFGLETKDDYIQGYVRFFPECQPDGANSLEYWQKNLMLIFKGINAEFEITLLNAEGKLIYTDVVGYLLQDGSEQLAVTYSRDITCGKQVVMERERAKIAEENSQAKSKFLANMSHEIRTPISAVIGISEIQLRNRTLPVGIQEAFVKIHDSARILLSIINDILDISKVESGKMPIIVGKYEIADLINDTIQLNLIYLGSKQIKFETKIDEDMPASLYGDDLRIKQVINNLISNAFKYTDFGTVTLEVRCDNADDFSDGSVVDIVIVISDTGRGMTKQQQEALKEEYTRFHEHSSRHTQGTGLGMAIVSKMLGLMSGEINVDSVVDVGTSVRVRIPQKAAGSKKLGPDSVERLTNFDAGVLAHTQRSMFKPVPMPYGTVLVVDDVDTNLYVAKSLLKFYEIQVETVSSGYAAIDKVSAGNVYDIIFMDHMMPGIDGIETTKIIRADGYTRPIVALTANALIGQAEEFMNNGFDGFVSKPIQTVHLDSILHKFIKDRHFPEDVGEPEEQPEDVPDFDDYMQNSEILQVVYREFLDTQKSVIQEIKNALVTDDFGTAERLAHTLKGLAGLLSEERLMSLAGENEAKFRAKGFSLPKLTELEEELSKVMAVISRKVENG